MSAEEGAFTDYFPSVVSPETLGKIREAEKQKKPPRLRKNGAPVKRARRSPGLQAGPFFDKAWCDCAECRGWDTIVAAKRLAEAQP